MFCGPLCIHVDVLVLRHVAIQSAMIYSTMAIFCLFAYICPSVLYVDPAETAHHIVVLSRHSRLFRTEILISIKCCI